MRAAILAHNSRLAAWASGEGKGNRVFTARALYVVTFPSHLFPGDFTMRLLCRHYLGLLLCAALAALPAMVLAQTPKIGIVVMHGKGGAPNKFVDVLASGLEEKGLLVANLEMPWSKRREFDVPTETADAEILAALAGLKAKGAQKLFVAGHSHGGMFAVHFGATHPVDGIIAIAPGGSTGAPVFLDSMRASLAEARRLVAEGRGKEKAALMDYEGSKGHYAVNTTPENFLSWYDPAGAMNMTLAAPGLKAPILWMVAARDYPGLRKGNLPAFRNFPAHPLNRLKEPDSDHLNAPAASLDEIVSWTAAVAAQR
jgi:pimeloyl-ACP methyl ester carboxylesterase